MVTAGLFRRAADLQMRAYGPRGLFGRELAQL